MAQIELGTFYDSFCGGSYTCYLIYDTPTRSGDSITIRNIKARIVAKQSWGTEGRIGVKFELPNGTGRVDNGTVANSYSYPTDTTYTLSSSITVTNLTTSVSFWIKFSDTGYGSSWNDGRSQSFSGSISCPARTYTVSYNANGGSGAPSNQTKTYNIALALSSTKPTRTGYSFLRWNTNSSGTGTNYSSGGSYTGNSDLSLYAVWQPQVSDISSATDTTLGNACSVTWTPKVETNKYRLAFTIGDWSSGDLPSSSTYISGSSSDITYTSYTIPIDGPAQKITSASTGTMTATLTTYDSNGTLLGSTTKTFTVTVPTSCKPSVVAYATGTPYVAQTSDNATINSWGVFVAGYSKAVCKAKGSAQYGASITRVQVSGDFNASGTTSLDETSGIFTAGTKTLTFTVTDSRGMVSEAVTQTITVYPYSAPSITGFSGNRDSVSVTVVKVLAAWTYASVASNNSVTAVLKYKASTASTWNPSEDTSITSGTEKTLSWVFTDSVSYKLQLTVTDSVGNYDQLEIFIPTIFVWMHMPVNGAGVAFGKVAETGNFEIAYPLEVYDDISSSGDITAVGDIEGDNITALGDLTGVDAEVSTLIVGNITHTITDAEYLELATLLADNYSTTASYFVGEFCIYNAGVYECKSAIVSGETWTASHWDLVGNFAVYKHNGFDTYTIVNAQGGTVFTPLDNGNILQGLSDGNNSNISRVTLSQRILYSDIKNKRCRFSWNISCDGISQLDGTNASGNIGFGLYQNAIPPSDPLSDRTASYNIAPYAEFLGSHSKEFVLDDLFNGATNLYFAWNIGFRSSTNGQTINITNLTFEVLE